MAGDANAFRKASIELLRDEIDALRRTLGLVVKSTRAYKSPGRPDGKRQTQVAGVVGISQPRVSQFENGSISLTNANLRRLHQECGFDVRSEGGQALEAIIRTVRDHEGGIDALLHEAP
jgi:transcriptional regulator with XRE-family HTH domain